MFCASWSFASVRFLQGGENVCKVLKEKKSEKKKSQNSKSTLWKFFLGIRFFIEVGVLFEVVSTSLKIF